VSGRHSAERLTGFEKLVLAAIVANTGVLVWSLCDHTHEAIIEPMHTGFLVFFCIELIVRVRSAGSLREFVRSGWNVFDTIVILLSLMPVLMPVGGDSWLRTARAARIVHSLRHVSHLRVADFLRLREQEQGV
jgi:voltage-gated sodium channel